MVDGGRNEKQKPFSHHDIIQTSPYSFDQMSHEMQPIVWHISKSMTTIDPFFAFVVSFWYVHCDVISCPFRWPSIKNKKKPAVFQYTYVFVTSVVPSFFHPANQTDFVHKWSIASIKFFINTMENLKVMFQYSFVLVTPYPLSREWASSYLRWPTVLLLVGQSCVWGSLSC